MGEKRDWRPPHTGEGVERLPLARLLVHVEGDAEELFVNEVLGPHLYEHGYSEVAARVVGQARQRRRRGGIVSWPVAQREIVSHLKGDRGCLATTLIDYYGLPREWPGRDDAHSLPGLQKAEHVEQALLSDTQEVIPDGSRRFIPFVMLHEFEALLFSNCERFADAIDHPEMTLPFQAIRDQFSTPEEIDDSPQTAPSKRILKLCPDYEKPLMGILAALAVGLETMRRECPHFADWLRRLENSAMD